MKRRITEAIQSFVIALGALAMLAGLLAWHHMPSGDDREAVITASGIWYVGSRRAPERIWTWETEERLILWHQGLLYAVDGTTVRYHMESNPYAPDGWRRWVQQLAMDWTLEGRDVAMYTANNWDVYLCHARTERGLTAEVDGRSIPVREIMLRHYSATKSVQLPIWEAADPCLWWLGQWIYSLAKVDDALCVAATRPDEGLHIVSDALPYQERDFSVTDAEGRPCVLRPQEDGSLRWWTLLRTHRELPEKIDSVTLREKRDADRFTWVEQPTLTVAEHPSLARPYKLDLSQGRRELLYLDEAGHLCITDLDPDAKPVVLDDSLTLTEADLDRIERYGNAITFPLPDGSTRVWFPRSNVFGRTRWLTWDLP